MRICVAVLMCLCAVNCWAQENNQPSLVHIYNPTNDGRIHALAVVDGELLCFWRLSDSPDPDAKIYNSIACSFELHTTPMGQLIRVRAETPQHTKQFEYEGYYVTADYFSTPPSIIITKEPEKYSYWIVSRNAKAPIFNMNGFKTPAYFGLDFTIIKTKAPGSNGHQESRKVTLSLDPKYQFEVAIEHH
jgi:hypothetical protein